MCLVKYSLKHLSKLHCFPQKANEPELWSHLATQQLKFQTTLQEFLQQSQLVLTVIFINVTFILSFTAVETVQNLHLFFRKCSVGLKELMVN